MYKFLFAPFSSLMPDGVALAAGEGSNNSPAINPTPAPSFAGRGLNRTWQEAARLNITDRQLRDWQARGLVPFIKIGRVVLFDPQRVDAALNKFERNKGAAK